ncbi:MAG: hypothetical protein HY240_10930 [Actinobacteria bacterium]|nr:hypothetical protein [Actinomycetota bacterium]
MKRFMVVLAGAAASGAVFAGSALAGDSYPPSPTRTPTVLPTIIHRADPGTAFTGANLTLGFVALAGLILVGAIALFVARRRAARSGA